jgi:hypothetical protein
MATWCPVCVSEIPHLNYLRAALPESEVTFYALASDAADTPEALAAYLKQHHPPYLLLEALRDDDRERILALLRERLGEVALPSTIILDARGDLWLIRKGTPTLSEIRHLQNRLR